MQGPREVLTEPSLGAWESPGCLSRGRKFTHSFQGYVYLDSRITKWSGSRTEVSVSERAWAVQRVALERRGRKNLGWEKRICAEHLNHSPSSLICTITLLTISLSHPMSSISDWVLYTSRCVHSMFPQEHYKRNLGTALGDLEPFWPSHLISHPALYHISQGSSSDTPYHCMAPYHTVCYSRNALPPLTHLANCSSFCKRAFPSETSPTLITISWAFFMDTYAFLPLNLLHCNLIF